MFTDTISSVSIGWVAIATGIAGLLGFIFIVLFFTVGQPFGTLNDIFIGLTAIMSLVLMWMSYRGHHTQSPLLSQVALVIASLGVILVVVGSVLSIAGITGWYRSGLFMVAGNALIGLWLVTLSYSAMQNTSFPHGLAIFGLVSGVILTLGLVAIPGILRGTDTKEYLITTVNLIWWTASLGYLILYPVWSFLVGRALLQK